MPASNAGSAATAKSSATVAGAVPLRPTPRGTQSFVHILALCWRRPSLLLSELLWRWSFGLPLLIMVAWQASRIWSATAAPLQATGVFQFSLEYPMLGAVQVAEAIDVLRPPILHAAMWLGPGAMMAWAVAAGLGRNAVLRRYDPALPWRPAAMTLLQLIRIVALAASFAVWFAAVHWAADYSLSTAPAGSALSAGPADEPNLVLYCALVIVFSLGIFTVWALLSWIFSIAPLLTVLEDRGMGRSLLRSFRLGPLAGKLVEINLVMGIVKLALIVLAMVFSATPLPFESVVNGQALYAWWAAVTLLYLIASDFFQVARTVAFVELWKLYANPTSSTTLIK